MDGQLARVDRITMFGTNSESDGDEGKKVDTKVGTTNAGLPCKAEAPVDADDPAKTAPGTAKAGACKESSEGTAPKPALLDELASDV